MNVKELLSLKNKVLLVTGGAGNYGKCIVEGLAEADGTVVIASRNLETGAEVAADFRRKGLDVHALQVDQGDHQSILQLKKKILQEFGKLDGFVNNAVSRPMGSYEAPIEHFAESMRVNATGMMDILREMAELLVQNKGGSIINIGSMMSIFGASFAAPYGASKGAVVQLTKSLAAAWAADNIQVNAVLPGWIDTDLTKGAREQVQGLHEKVLARTPAGRWGEPADFKGPVVFLASPASDYVHGTILTVDGGWMGR